MESTEEVSLADLDKYRVAKESIDTIYYIPNFIDVNEEKSLLTNVDRAPKPRWTQLSNRRLQNWGGIPTPKGMLAEEIPSWLKIYIDKIGNLSVFNNNKPNHVLINEYLPGQGILPHLDGALFYPVISKINLGSHTLLNFYNPIDEIKTEVTEDKSTSNIPKMIDNQNENVDKSLTDDVIKPWSERLAFSLLLEPRSLVILKDQAYQYYLHGINETNVDTITSKILNLDLVTDYDTTIGVELERTTRISLTIRNVPRTTKKPILRLGR